MHDVERLTAALADRYALKGEAGRGAMATVYLAEDLKHRRRVAIKVLNPELAAVLGPERFLREIELAAGLSHPHILPVFDSGNADGHLFYVMPYVEGESLRDRLKREKQLPVDEALQICREIADGLSYAHAHGVVHRDIKPENIMLQGGHAIIADFGIAHAIDRAGGDQLTGTGVTIGTPTYMSPEQALAGDVDGRSDLYSLGCVLYELLAGQPPFTGPTVQSLVHQHVSATPPSILQIRPGVPAHVAATLQRALSKTPADRFNPVALFAEALGHNAPTATTPIPVERTRPRIPLIAIGVVIVIALGALVAQSIFGRGVSQASAYERTAIAVLPFENLSGGESNASFAGGLHNELMTQLSKVASLRVMGRISVMPYAGSTKGPAQIAEELEVGSIVEGSVQVMGTSLRVTVSLLDIATGEMLWSNTYEETLDDAFAIQSDIAQKVVTALGAALAGTERDAIAAAPTANAEAYRMYLQAREYQRRPGRLRADAEAAIQLLDRAVALDPQFALAHAAIAESHGVMFWFRYDPSSERAARQRTSAETALRLAPDLPQAHWAIGMSHYWGRRDYRRALDELAIAAQSLNDSELISHIGAVHRRLGNWTEVFATYDKAVSLDPRNVQLFADLGGNTFIHTRRYGDAVEAFNRALALAPDQHEAAVRKAHTFTVWTGQLDSMRSTLAALPLEMELSVGGSVIGQTARLLLMERQPDSLLALIGRTQRNAFSDQTNYLPTSLYAAWAHTLRADNAAARAAYTATLAHLDSLRPDLVDHRVHAARGLTHAGLGNKADALREAEWLRQAPVYTDDALLHPEIAQIRAMIFARAGDANAALEEIEAILRGPGGISVHTLRLDPRWDPIRDNPRFKALLVKYANPGAR
jgi:eukaryotic-like serine/threonine-protein kinase